MKSSVRFPLQTLLIFVSPVDPCAEHTLPSSHVGLGVNFLDMVEKGVVAWEDGMRRHEQSRENIEMLGKIGTRDGLVTYLVKAIPCSCVDLVPAKFAKSRKPK